MTSDADITRLRAEFQQDLARLSSASDLQVAARQIPRKKERPRHRAHEVGGLRASPTSSLRSARRQRAQAGNRAAAHRPQGGARCSTQAPVGAVDISLPGRVPQVGHRHPLTIVREEIEAIFTRMGYQVLEGPEIEDDYHNFEALNMPPEHPARDMQDTLYLDRRGRRAPDGRRRCCARTRRRCRFATWRATSLRYASSCRARYIAATISTSLTRRCSSRSKASSSATASRWPT